MENIYAAYTKDINGLLFYFVKKYQTFPEYKEVAPVLENYGMHTDFNKACKIALINDEAIKRQLSASVEIPELRGQIIKMNRSKVHPLNYRNWQLNFPSMLKLLKVR